MYVLTIEESSADFINYTISYKRKYIMVRLKEYVGLATPNMHDGPVKKCMTRCKFANNKCPRTAVKYSRSDHDVFEHTML